MPWLRLVAWLVVRLGDDVFDVFKALITADTWVREISKTVLGNPIDPQTEMEQ